ncbi:hypothetical protein VTN00DRAFT_9706 [Thermoascus crustaceus]|uniref:uncharacterized protein n=1 Tax=Thermoascus crustaceus TaxID=5088 RepID=UPI0037429392
MNPYLSWAIVLVVAGSLGWYYNNTPNIKGKAAIKPAVKPAVEKSENTQSAKKQKQKTKKTPKPSSAPVSKPEEKPVAQAASQDADKPEEDIDNKEFARRFAAVKTGVSPSPNRKDDKKEKRAKKAAASQLESGSSEVSGSHVSTRASSTTGADADDDLSPAGSPEVKATVPTAGYVSDMLETPAPGASVLRLTGSVESQSKKQKPQSFKPVETKKQRQQRLKNEARKQQIQEAEQERRKLLEKQLHTAREAERREAARSKQTPPPNAWKANNATNMTNGASTTIPSQHAELLDTFDKETPSAKPQQASKNSKQVNNSTQGKWAQGLPPEDEQMRILGAASSENEWTTVSTKKGKKKTEKADESVSDADASTSENQATSDWTEPKISPMPLQEVPRQEIPRRGQKGHPLDSDWIA